MTRIDHVKIYSHVESALQEWKDLIEAGAPHSIYQLPDYVDAWMTTLGVEEGYQPLISIGYDEQGQALVLCPFVIQHSKRGGAYATFAGGSHANVNMCLVHPSFSPTQVDIEDIFRKIAQKSNIVLDGFRLPTQPEIWNTQPYSVLSAYTFPNPVHRYCDDVPADPNIYLHSHFSPKHISRFKGRLRALEALGPVRLRKIEDKEELTSVIDFFFQWQLSRFESLKFESSFRAKGAYSFIRDLALRSLEIQAPILEFRIMEVGDAIIAISGGGRYKGTFYSMMSAFNPDPLYSKYSPVNMIRYLTLLDLCRQPIQHIDLGVGATAHKKSWAKREEKMLFTFYPLTLRGRLWGHLQRMRVRVMGYIRTYPLLFKALRRIKWLFSTQVSPQDLD